MLLQDILKYHQHHNNNLAKEQVTTNFPQSQRLLDVDTFASGFTQVKEACPVLP